MRGEQRAARTDETMNQRALGRAGRHRVHAAQQQGVMSQQQMRTGAVHFVHHRGSRINGNRHGVDLLIRVAADQAHRIPRFGQRRRIGRVEHADDVREPHTHYKISFIACTSSGHSGRTATRR
ncbi:Uncharacterised protein [Mycobacteroides abscessus subsp. abscessus]|nr:Uncharacterised protein [Mycobacteroides abscessus subsp. abscessus]